MKVQIDTFENHQMIVVKFFFDSTPTKECIVGEQMTAAEIGIFYEMKDGELGRQIWVPRQEWAALGLQKTPSFECLIFGAGCRVDWPGDKPVIEAVKKHLLRLGYKVAVRY